MLAHPEAGGPVPADVGVLSLNTASRHLLPDQARVASRLAVERLHELGCRSFYQKIDSTLRGALADQIAATRMVLGCAMAVVAPAFPAAGRVMVGGHLLVDGVPLEHTAYARDPLSPATDSYLPGLLAETGERVGHVPYGVMRQGWEAIATELVRLHTLGVTLVAADVATEAELPALAAAIQRLPFLILPAGSAALARALAALRAPAMLLDAPRPAPAFVGRTPPVLVVNGSANPVSLAQVARLSAHAVQLDIRQHLMTGEAAVTELAIPLIQRLLAGEDVVLSTVAVLEQVQRDQAFARELGLTPYQLGRHLGVALAGVVARVAERIELPNLVLVGGETATAVCERLGDRLEVVEAVLPAIPLHQVVGADRRIVTKSGGFGAPDTLEAIVAHLRRTGRPARAS